MFKYLKIIFLLILFPVLVLSKDILKLQEAISIGLKNNYGITILTNELEIAKNNITAGNAGYLPKIDLNADYSKGISNAEVESATGAKLDKTGGSAELLNLGVNLKWTVFDGLKMFINHNMLEKMRDISDLNLKIKVENTIAKIITTYNEIISQQKVIDILNEQISISDFRVNLASISFETGSGSELELLKAKVDLNFDKSDLLKQEAVLTNLKSTINELLSRDINTDFDILDSIKLNDILNYEELKNSIYESNKYLKLAKENKILTGYEDDKILSKQYPTLNFQAGYNYLDNNTEVSIVKLNHNYGYILGLSASYNIFNGSNDIREHQNALINIINSDLKIKELENSLNSYLNKIYNDYKIDVQLIDYEKENLILSNKNMDVAKESYSVGSISSLELREVQKALLQAGTRFIDSQFKAKVKETELLMLSGKIIN